MIDIFNKAKEFIGLGDEMEGEVPIPVKLDSSNIDYAQVRQKTNKKVSNADFEISIYEPRAYENSIDISARLRQGNPVIVNLKYLDSSEGTRLIDFVCGTAFAIDGHMMKIADTIFLLSPSNVAISDFSERASQETQSKGEMFQGRLQ